jgi:hypothetical protein
MKTKFYKCAIFSFYIGKGIMWFKLFKLKLCFRHINEYEFTIDNPKGFFWGNWLIDLQ